MEAIRIGDPEIEVWLRRNANAKRMLLRVCQTLGTPVLTLPPRASLAVARTFVLEQEGWLRRHVEAVPCRTVVGAGTVLPYRGKSLTVLEAPGRTSIQDGFLRVAGPAGRIPARVLAYLREAARQRSLAGVTRHAGTLGVPFGRITLRDTRGRWGSCTGAGDLMFSWRLILAPDAVLDYVAAHEVAHLVEMNHSARFWKTVAGLCPDHAVQRTWLRQHGRGLMAFDFMPPA